MAICFWKHKRPSTSPPAEKIGIQITENVHAHPVRNPSPPSPVSEMKTHNIYSIDITIPMIPYDAATVFCFAIFKKGCGKF